MPKSGINGYNGEILDEFFNLGVIVRGNTVPLDLTLSDGVTTDYTGFSMLMTFDTVITCEDTHTPDLEITVPLVDAANGVFSGYLTDDDAFNFAVGDINVSLKYIDSDGRAFILDMAKYKVVNCLNPKRA